MPITIELPEDFFKDQELEKLKVLFHIQDDNGFSEVIQKVACAALSEYKEMFLGMGLPSRADEIMQHRLYYLIKYYFETTLPPEAEVSSLFQLTQSRSKTLIRYVMARFRNELEKEIKNTLRETIQRAKLHKDSEAYRVVIQSENVLAELNQIIELDAPDLDPIKKVQHMSKTFSISVDSYNVLRDQLGIGGDGQR